MLLETYGSADRTLEASAAIHVCEAGEVYARDDFVYWGFTPAGLRRLAHDTGYEGFEFVRRTGSSAVIRASSERCAPAPASPV